MSSAANPHGRRYAELSEAASYLGKTPKALRKLVERRAVPFRRAGKRLVFDLAELDRWVAGLPGVTLEEALDQYVEQVPRNGDARRAGSRGGSVPGIARSGGRRR